MTLNALVFDFDGLILDTEWPEYQAWQEIFVRYGQDLQLDVWSQCVGRSAGYFDPVAHLESLTETPFNAHESLQQRTERIHSLLDAAEPLPGVLALLEEADRLGIPLAVASSSTHQWVDGHLKRLGLYDRFEAILCADDVSEAKPSPELYQAALSALDAIPAEAAAFEDSPNGIASAKAAGIFTVAVPNRLTQLWDTSQADLVISSLEEVSVRELAKVLEKNQEIQTS